MSDPVSPNAGTDQAPAVTAPPITARPAAAPPAAALASAWGMLDRFGQVVVGGGLAAAAIALIGIVVGTWSLIGFGIVVLLAGLVAAAVAWLTAAGYRTWPIAPPYLEVAAGLVATALALLNLIELAFDLDQLDEWGGPIGGLLSLAVAVAAVAVLLVAAMRAGVAGPRSWLAPRPVQLATIGTVLVFIGVALGLSIGILTFAPRLTFTVAATVLALVAVRAAAEPGAIRLPVPAGWMAVALAALAVLPALDLLGAFMRSDNPGLDDWLFLLVHLVGLALVVVASLLSAGLRIPARAAPPGVPPAA